MRRPAALLTVLLLASAAHAIDHDNIDAGRPLLFDDATSIAYRERALEIGADRGLSAEYLYGFARNTHLSIGFASYSTDRQEASIGLFRSLNRETLGTPAAAVRADVTLGSSQGPRLRLRGILSRTVRQYSRLHLNADATVNFRPTNGERAVQPALILGLTRPLGYPTRFDRTGLAEIAVRSGERNGSGAVVSAGVGLRQQVTVRSVFDVGLQSDIAAVGRDTNRTGVRLVTGYSTQFRNEKKIIPMCETNTPLNRRALLSGLLGGALLLGLPTLAFAHDVKDPVCRMAVDSDTTPFTHKIGGKTFYFCSTTCRDKFVAAPAKYTKLAAELETSEGSTYAARVSSVGASLAGKKTTLNIRILNETKKKTVTDFEMTHEKKMHFLMVSEDMTWFSHEHPDLGKDGVFRLRTTFPRPGRYHLYADCTPADGDNQILPMLFTVGGTGTPIAAVSSTRPLTPDTKLIRRVGAVIISVSVQPQSLRREQPAILTYTLQEASGRPIHDMEPYLGTMGHLMAIRQDGAEIVHTHALHAVAPGVKVTEEGGLHLTWAMSTSAGPTFSFKVTLPSSGIYKIWAQFQRKGEVITVPFTFRVADIWETAPAPVAATVPTVQKATIRVDGGVYSPADVTVAKGQPVELTFIGGTSMGCGSTVVFPELGIRKALAAGVGTVVAFTPTKTGPLRFTCPMKMYQGQVTVK